MNQSCFCQKCSCEIYLSSDVVPDTLYSCPKCHCAFTLQPSNGQLALVMQRDTFNARGLASQMKIDCEKLMELGINLDKGALGAKVGGLGGAAFAAFRGHPLIGLAIGVGGFLVKTLTDDVKEIKLQEIRKKWFSILSSLNQTEVQLLFYELHRNYPMLSGQVQGLFQLPGS